jgi:hypothetical protein
MQVHGFPVASASDRQPRRSTARLLPAQSGDYSLMRSSSGLSQNVRTHWHADRAAFLPCQEAERNTPRLSVGQGLLALPFFLETRLCPAGPVVSGMFSASAGTTCRSASAPTGANRPRLQQRVTPTAITLLLPSMLLYPNHPQCQFVLLPRAKPQIVQARDTSMVAGEAHFGKLGYRRHLRGQGFCDRV